MEQNQVALTRGRKRRKHITASTISIVISVLFALYLVIIFVPYVYGIMVSLESDYEYQNTIFPAFRSFEIQNYARSRNKRSRDAWKLSLVCGWERAD